MNIPTIPTELSDAKKERLSFRGKNATKTLVLENGKLYLSALLEVRPDMKQDDYDQLASRITDVTDVEGVQFGVDHKTKAVVSVDHTQVADISVSIRLRQDTPVEP